MTMHGFATDSVLYAEDFDDYPADLVVATPEPEIIDPVFTLAELESARAAAHAAGVAAERARAEGADAAARTRALEYIAAALADAREAARHAAEDAAEGLAQAVLSVVAAGLPALCVHHGDAEARALLAALLPTLGSEPRITIRLNPRLASIVQADLAGLDADLAAAIHLTPTEALAPGDVRVSWDGGACQRSAAAACDAVRNALAPLGLLLPSPAPETRPDLL